MNCEAAHNLIHARLDEELTTAQEQQLAGHLQSCEECRRINAQLQAMASGFDWLAEHSDSVQFEQSHALPSAQPAQIIKFPLLRWAGGIAAAAAAVFLLMTWLNNDKQEELQLAKRVDQHTTPAPVELKQPDADIRLVGQTYDDYIAVKQKTTNPRVHIVWLHPIDKPKQPNGSTQAPTMPGENHIARS